MRGKYSGMSAIGSGKRAEFLLLYALTQAGMLKFAQPSTSMIEATPFWLRFALDLFACESMLDCGGFAFVAKRAGLRAKNFTKFRLALSFLCC